MTTQAEVKTRWRPSHTAPLEEMVLAKWPAGYIGIGYCEETKNPQNDPDETGRAWACGATQEPMRHYVATAPSYVGGAPPGVADD